MNRRIPNKKATVSFQVFWDAYGLKRDRIAAERAWNRLSAKDRKAAFAGIAPYRERCRQTGIAMMYAQGYLNRRRWENDTDKQPCQENAQTKMETW